MAAEWFSELRPRRPDTTPESIYGLLPDTPVQIKKPAMYRSIHDGRAPPTASTFNISNNTFSCGVHNVGGSIDVEPAYRKPYSSHKMMRARATFGPPRTGGRRPSDYLRRSAPFQKQASKFKYGDEHKRKPSCPRRDDMPVHGLTTSKNFVTSNAIENILSEPPKRHNRSSNNWLHRKDYGEIPEYLRKMKQRHAKRVQELQNDELNRVRAQQNSLKLLSQEERADIVRKLKSKWDAVNIEYQKSSTLDLRIMTGARGKIRRKEQFEAELQQIESYIDRLTAKRNVFVKA